MAYAFEDWKLQSPKQKEAIKNRGGWLVDRYKRAHLEIINAAKPA
jgi:hypothetical protein